MGNGKKEINKCKINCGFTIIYGTNIFVLKRVSKKSTSFLRSGSLKIDKFERRTFLKKVKFQKIEFITTKFRRYGTEEGPRKIRK